MKKNLLLIFILILAFILRVPFLDKYPAGLNADEAAIGYNAYSLLTTGKDEHGASWPLVFRSFDDYKPAGYFYLVLPFVAALGLNVWAVRLPSALLGVLSVYFIYLLTNKLFPNKKILNTKYLLLDTGGLAALVLAVSPWHIHFSRGGWEANAASTFMLIGLHFLVKSLENSRYFFLSTFAFILSLYTYHSLRLILPLLFLTFVAIYLGEIKVLLRQANQLKPVVASIIIGVLLLIPLIKQFTSAEGGSRFSGVSIFADSGPYWEALEYRDHANIWTNRLLHSQYITYSQRFIQNYLSHFSPIFLFISGDEIARSKTPGVGQLLLVTAPFLFLGFLILFSSHIKQSRLILSWLFIAPLAAALTFQSPHALRAQNMIYPLAIIISLGLFKAIILISRIKINFILYTFYFLLTTISGYEFARYLHQYFVHYPQELPFAWQYGFDQIGAYAQDHYDQYDHLIISDRYDQPYILLAFFTKYPPTQMQKEIKLTPRDKFGFSTVTNFGKYEFHRIDWAKDSLSQNSLIIAADEAGPDNLVVDRIADPSGKTMFRIFDTNKLK